MCLCSIYSTNYQSQLIKNQNYQSTEKINRISIPSNLSPCPWPRQSGDTAIAATSPHFSSKKGKSAAQAIIWPSLSTTMKELNDWSSYIKKERRNIRDLLKKLLVTAIRAIAYAITVKKIDMAYASNTLPSTLFLRHMLSLAEIHVGPIKTCVPPMLSKIKLTSSSVRLTNMPDSSKGWISCFIPEKSVTRAIRVPS